MGSSGLRDTRSSGSVCFRFWSVTSDPLRTSQNGVVVAMIAKDNHSSLPVERHSIPLADPRFPHIPRALNTVRPESRMQGIISDLVNAF